MFQENVNLKSYNTFGISAISSYFATFSSVKELRALLENKPSAPLMILGGGSNILFRNDFNGLILANRILGKEVIQEDEKHVYIKVGAGENWHEFVRYCIRKNWSGIENLSLIPGNVGASPMQNIGAYGVEIKDTFDHLEAYHLESGKVHTFNHAQCEFGYRESVFKRKLKGQYVILNVTYRLNKNHQLNTSYGAIEEELREKGITQPTLADVSDAVIAIRQSKLPDPKEIGNAGSFFKNPVVPKTTLLNIQVTHPTVPFYPVDDLHVKIPAGWLIETAGWKGKRLNNHGVHAKQALVLVNYSDASGDEIYALSEAILQDIHTKFGVELEREVNIL